MADGGHHNRHHSHHGAHYFWEPPRLRKSRPEDEQEMHEDWLELVGDLIFVACLYKLGNTAKYCGWNGLLATIPIFFTVWRGLLWITQYVNGIDTDDILRLLQIAMVLLGTFIMVLNINDGSEEGYQQCVVHDLYAYGFLVGYVVSRLAVISLYVVAYINICDRREFILRFIVTVGVAAVVATAWTVLAPVVPLSAFINGGGSGSDEDEWQTLAGSASGPVPAPAPGEDEYVLARPGLLLAGYALCFVIEQANFIEIALARCGVFNPPRFILLHIAHWVERRNVFFMICIGESMMALLVEQLSLSSFSRTKNFQCLSFLICFGIALLNYNTQPHKIDCHVIRVSGRRAMLQNYSYWFLNYFAFLVGVGLKLELYILANGSPGDHRVMAAHETWNELKCVMVLGVALMLSQLLLTANDVLQKGERSWATTQKKVKLIVRILLALGHCGWYFYCLAVGRDRDLIMIDCWIHLALILPAIFIDLELHKVMKRMRETQRSQGEASPTAESKAPLAQAAALTGDAAGEAKANSSH